MAESYRGFVSMLQKARSRRLVLLLMLVIISVGLQVALTHAEDVTSCEGYGCSVRCDGYSVGYGAYNCNGNVGCDAYARCSGSVNADGYIDCLVESGPSSVNCDAYLACSYWGYPSTGCDAYLYCPSVGCDAYVGGCGADLAVTGASIPSVVNKGESVDISWTVSNVGNGIAWTTWGWWSDSVYLSTDTVLDDSDDRMVAWDSHWGSLYPGESYSRAHTWQVANIPNGDYYLIVESARYPDMGETNMDNNLFVSPRFTVQGDDPDLVMTNASAPAVIEKGVPFDITATVENRGAGAAIDWYGCDRQPVTNPDGSVTATACSPWHVFYLSSDDQLGFGEDIWLATGGPVADLAPGGSYDASRTVTAWNLPSGTYYLIGAADPHGFFYEENEDNNIVIIGQVEVTGEDPDLTVTSIDAPATVALNQPFDISWTVTNQGAGGAALMMNYGWSDYVVISTDDQMDASDYSLYSGQRWDPLAAGGSYTTSSADGYWSPMIWGSYSGITPGDYYLIVKTDYYNYLYETNEDNNYLAVPITIASPDLVPTAINAPATVTPGEPLDVSWTIENQSAVAFSTAYMGFGPNENLYFSQDDQLDSNDSMIGWAFGSDMPPWGSETTSSWWGQWVVPYVVPGTYYLILEVDAGNNFAEANEDNNIIVKPITIASVTDGPYARIEIDHTWRGDLVVTLGVGDPNAPLWSKVVSNREGGSANDIYMDVPLDAAAQNYLPPSEQNRWFLKVEDRAGADIGNISSFGLYMHSEVVLAMATDTPVPIYDYQTSYSYIPSLPVDDTPPVISDIEITPGCNSAMVTWTTDEPATSAVSVQYGSVFSDETLTTSHIIHVSGLASYSEHTLQVKSGDAAGNAAYSGWMTFTTYPGGPPNLSLGYDRVYWASPDDFAARRLSVDFHLVNLVNQAGRGAYGVQVTGANNTNGVELRGSPDGELGDLPGGESLPFTLQYYVPPSVTGFRTTVEMSASDVCGTRYDYPLRNLQE